MDVQGDQKVSVHLMITIQKVGAQRHFFHPVQGHCGSIFADVNAGCGNWPRTRLLIYMGIIFSLPSKSLSPQIKALCKVLQEGPIFSPLQNNTTLSTAVIQHEITLS